jgi:hypothetical protein
MNDSTRVVCSAHVCEIGGYSPLDEGLLEFVPEATYSLTTGEAATALRWLSARVDVPDADIAFDPDDYPVS